MSFEGKKESYPLDLTKELKQASEKVSNEIVHALNTLGRNLQGRDNEEKVEDEECCFVIVDDDTVTGVCRDGDDTMESKDDGSLSKDSRGRALPKSKGRGLKKLLSRSKSPSKSRDHKSPYSRASPIARMRDSEEQKLSELQEMNSTSKPSRNSEDVKKSWTRRFRKAQKEKKREQLSLDGGNSFESGPDTVTDSLSDDGPRAPRRGRNGLLDPLFNAAMVIGEMRQMDRNDIFAFFESRCGLYDDNFTVESGFSSNDSLSTYTPPRARRRSRSKSSERQKKTEKQWKDFEYRTPPRRKRSSSKPRSSQIPTNPPETKNPSPIRKPNVPMVSPPANASKESSKYVGTKKSPSREVHPRNKNFIQAFIQDMGTRGCRMLWYKERSSAAVSVKLYLQNGHQSETKDYCGPALVWADENEKDQFYGVSLFDIRSLDRVTSAQLEGQNARRSILIRLSKGNNFVFEAESEDDAFRFLHGMKWMIARFSFNLILGNLDVSREMIDIGSVKLEPYNPSRSPRSLLEEAEAAKAVDDVTIQMMDKCIYNF